jgi:hypothetical protein
VTNFAFDQQVFKQQLLRSLCTLQLSVAQYLGIYQLFLNMSLSFTVLPQHKFSKMRENFDWDNLNLSFNGCGFLGIYHVGVASALKHHLPNTKFKNVCGASAGAMAAVCLLGEVPMGKFNYTRCLLRYAPRAL